MKNKIKEIEERYNIELNIDRERLDALDNRSPYMTRVWKVINGNTVCITYTKISNIEEKMQELEEQIKKALN